jgi:Stage II sporulation protein E (SpoIIE)
MFQKSFINTVPRKSLIIFFFGVFILFAVTGIVSDVSELGRTPAPRLWAGAFLSGLFATMYAASGFHFRRDAWKAMIPIFVVQFFAMGSLHNFWPSPMEPAQIAGADLEHLRSRLNFDAIAILVGVIVGYTCFVFVGVQEGKRYFRAHAEIALAQEIHRVLVPKIDQQFQGFAFYGYSKASGEVGGDLVDLVVSEKNWVAYLADVSGHGVAPGVLMGMLKSAAHMLLISGGESNLLMQRLNEVLYPLKSPDMFSTFCQVAKSGDTLRVGSAGHPPMLKFSAGSGDVTELPSENMPLGIIPEGEFVTSPVDAAQGDIFILYTDGFIEAVNKSGEEFGVGRVRDVLKEKAREGLQAVAATLQERVAQHGAQFDDQSILLVQKL